MDDPGKELLKRSYILALSPAEQEEAFAELGEQLFTRIITRSIGILSKADGELLVQLLEAGAEGNAIVNFLTERIPKLAELVSEEAEKLAKDRAELLPAV